MNEWCNLAKSGRRYDTFSGKITQLLKMIQATT